MLSKAAVTALCRGEHGDPFSVLGLHADSKGKLCLRTLQPGALSVSVIDGDSGKVIAELPQRKLDAKGSASGFFEGAVDGRNQPFKYRLRIVWPGGVQETADPYSFSTVLGELDVWLLAEGSHLRPFERLGAHLREIDGVKGTAFAVWAPDAQRVSVVGDFNSWDGRRHPMRLRRECGVWEIFLPDVGEGACYKYEIRTPDGQVLPLKADPYGFAAELRPSTASIVCALPQIASRQSLAAGSKLDTAISIYEVHLSSWKRADDGGFPRLAANRRNADPLHRRTWFYAPRTAADFGASLRRLVGLSTARPLRADVALRLAAGLLRLRRGVPRGRARGHHRLGSGAFPDRRTRPRPLRRPAAL